MEEEKGSLLFQPIQTQKEPRKTSQMYDYINH